LLLFLELPSAILEGIETAAASIWPVNLKISVFGKVSVSLYVCITIFIPNRQILRVLKFLMKQAKCSDFKIKVEILN
jgi:hypothetical protein